MLAPPWSAVFIIGSTFAVIILLMGPRGPVSSYCRRSLLGPVFVCIGVVLVVLVLSSEKPLGSNPVCKNARHVSFELPELSIYLTFFFAVPAVGARAPCH